MKNQSNNIGPKVIKRNDPSFPDYLNFELLRKEGIRHVGDLSGNIWTDHNAHDPGITILEMLCYALIDLGYRTQLPIEDLVAVDGKMSKNEDNFFTPAQILTNNPLTILDYRKLLIDIPGVRNAWLEVETGEHLFLKTVEQDCTLSCTGGEGDHKVYLNGLYQVFLELEPKEPGCTEQLSSAEKEDIIAKVRASLNQYRNLGEDFLGIQILCPEKIGVCASITLEEEADAERVNLEIYLALHRFLSPQIEFFTLSEMLAKGNTIEELFGGKPYFKEIQKLAKFDHIFHKLLEDCPDIESTFGFIDEDQLESIPKRKEIHLSDIFAIIACVEGVKSVEQLTFKSQAEGALSVTSVDACKEWVHHLAPNHVPIFCPELSCINYNKGATAKIRLNQEDQQLLFMQRATIPARAFIEEQNDLALPTGRNLPELNSYYSIQHEFPRNYGIGEGGLSPDADAQRTAQALQLKGYLLFYDQLLANYVGQVSHLRDLFSILPDSERDPQQRRTYFGGDLQSVPLVDQLVKFYTKEFQASGGIVENTVMALPVTSSEQPQAQLNIIEFDTPKQRELAVEQLQREFNQGEYSIEVKPDECGFIFTVKTSVNNILLHSKSTYKSQDQARSAAQTVAFLGTLPEAYRSNNDYQEQKFSFELVFKPVDYLNYLQAILEDKELYYQRRNQFLDHLLARFAEHFTDYSVLVFGFNQQQTDYELVQTSEIESKGLFLKNYPLISRNRGKAYNYQIDGWNTQNISGLERRVLALSGIHDWTRHNLCNFEVGAYKDRFIYQLTDQAGAVVLKSLEQYSSRVKAKAALNNLVSALKGGEPFLPDDKVESQKFSIKYRYHGGVAVHPKTYASPEQRDLELKSLNHLLVGLSEESVFVSKHAHYLELNDSHGKPLKRSRKRYGTQQSAVDAKLSFAEKINGQLWVDSAETKPKLELVSIDDHWFLNTLPFKDADITKEQFRWALQGYDGTTWLTSNQAFSSPNEANHNFIRFTDFDSGQLVLEKEKQSEEIKLTLKDQHQSVIAEQKFKNHKQADEISSLLNRFLKADKMLDHWLEEKPNIYGWEVWQGDETLLQGTHLYDDTRKSQQAAAYAQTLITKDQNWQILQEEDASFRVVLMDKNYRLATSTTGFETLEEATVHQRVITDCWQTEGYIITEGEIGYGYRIPHHEMDRDAVLTSYNCYKTKHQALLGIEELLATAKRKSAYFPSGDEANLNFSFLIRATGKRFLAQHPFSYGTGNQRDKALNATLNSLKKTKAPCKTSKEYIYTLTDDHDRELLRSARSYKSKAQAQSAYLDMLPQACLASNYEKQNGGDQYAHKLTLRYSDHQIMAEHPFEYINWDQGDAIIQAINEKLQHHTYVVSDVTEPFKWQYRYHWDSGDHLWKPLLQSEEQFETQKDAQQAFLKFKEDLGRLKVLIDDSNSASGLLFQKPRSKTIEARSVGDFENLDKAQKSVSSFLKKAADYHNLVASTSERATESIMKIPGKEGGNFVYRVVKKDEYYAYHPCKCGSEPLDELKEKLFAKAQAGYDYLDICLGGDITCLEKDQKWHFLIRDQETEEIYLRSYQGYPSKTDAEKGFDDLYLKIIEAASTTDNYGDATQMTPILLEETFNLDKEHCDKDQYPLAVVAKETASKYEVDQLAGLFCSYPIRLRKTDGSECIEKINGKYHFLVVLKHTHQVLFKSYQGYDSEELAFCAFEEQIQHILELACKEDSYKPVGSERAYPIVEEQVFNAEQTKPDQPLVVIAPSALNHYDRQALIRLFCKCKDLIKNSLPDRCQESNQAQCYFFQLINPDKAQNDYCPQDWVSRRCWTSILEAREAFRLFMKLLEFKGSFHSLIDEDACCCHRLVIREVLLESCIGYNDQQQAWDGLNHLLKVICEPDALHCYWDEEACCHRIGVVDPDYFVADHPQPYYHLEQANSVMSELVNKCSDNNGQKQFLWVCTQQIDEANRAKYAFLIQDDQKKTIWEGVRYYDKEQKAKEAGLLALQYAQSEDFYGVGTKGSIQLFDKNKSFEVPVASDLIATYGGGSLSNEQLQLQAKQNPYSYLRGEYHYQSYCPDFEIIEIEEESNTCIDGEVIAKRQFSKTKGAIVWQSRSGFDRRESLIDAYQEFDSLKENPDHYQVIDNCGCDQFNIVLTNPLKKLADHPQCYSSKIRKDKAIDRIIGCTDTEGMHLLEHLLLRPQTDDCQCFLPTFPDPSCALDFELCQPDPCLDEASLEEQQVLIPGADPYSFWATVVLPCWTKRFRRADFRQLFQNLLRKEAPAHIGLVIKWVSPQQLCDFESKYKNWIKWKGCHLLCHDDDTLCELIQCLSGLIDCPPDRSEEPDQCDCDIEEPFNITNLFVNYAFTSNREQLYPQKFVDFFNLADLSKVTGNVLKLNPKDFDWVYPRVLPGNIEVPIIDPVIPGNPEPEVQSLKTEAAVRRRMASYSTSIEALADGRFRKSEAYERTALFLKSTGSVKDYQNLMDYLADGAKRTRSENSKNRFINLTQNATGYFLDQQVLKDQNSLPMPVREVFKRLQTEFDNYQLLIANWNGEAWVEWHKAKVISKIKRLFK